MEDRRPHLEARPRNPPTNHRGPVDGEIPPRARNQTNLPAAANHAGRHPRASNHPAPFRQREERFRAMGRNPHQGRRNQEGQTGDEARDQRQSHNDTRRRNDDQEGRNHRPPWSSDNFQQWHTPLQKPAEQPQQTKRLGYKFLESLLQKEPSEVAITLATSLGLKELLSHSSMKPSFLQLICQVLRKACSSRIDRQSILHVLGVLNNSKFLRVCLPAYVVGMITEPIPDIRNQYPEHISNIISLLQDLVSVFPASSVQETSMLISLLPTSLNALRASGVDIEEETEKNLEKVQAIIKHLQEKRREGTLRVDTYTLVQAEAEGGVESYRAMPIYPTYNEVHLDERPFLRPNIISGKYESTAVYLDTHFRLLREDFVRPLREGILKLLQSFEDQGLRKRKFDDIRIYFDARIITPMCSASGIVYKVQFDTKPLKFVRWQNSKRLLYGSLVCMSKDNFETFLFATVSNREHEDLCQGIVQLCFNEQSQQLLADVQPSDSFLMVETTAYFEAYRHVLEGLQEVQEEDVPFQRNIVECDSYVREPRYLLMGGKYDFMPLIETPSSIRKSLRGAEALRCPRINVLDFSQWPSKEALRLDDSQMEALQFALTRELAIIQGPPGTGKTYVGLKIVQALLTNKSVWQINTQKFPILVVCYTNHALDQFLEGIYWCQKTSIVRVGGRSNSEILKQFTLRELRNKREFRRTLPMHLRRAYMSIVTDMKESEQKLQEGAQTLECTMRGVLREQHLEKYISPQHWESLMTRPVQDSDWVCVQPSKHSMMLEWLGLGVGSFTQSASPAGLENTAQAEGEEEEEGEEEGSLIEIAEEADLIQADRVIEEEEVVRPRRRKKEENGADQELAKMLLAMRLDQDGPGATAGPEQATEEWETQRSQKKKMKRRVKVELRKLNTMTEAEASAIQDVWQLDLSSRWQLYRLWLQMYQADTRRKILSYERQYRTWAERMAELRLQEDLHILKDAQVVGMTTTGAAKYRQILQQVEPRIVIVEEAAEVLEAHTIATLSKACQHLILIGDHQQLRPSANVYDLAKNFNLEVSLFERLVKVNIPFVRLNHQHRMRPEIARLLTPHIYQDLENHPSVLKYEQIKGVSSNLFFVEHNFPEQEIQEGKSHQNQHEAHFVVELCQYFLCQEYLPSQITILTTYTGQLFCLRKLMPAKTFAGIKVHVVDKYQGEENDIILLSLVRSNKEGKVGFLQIPNRICVALSRAKKGMYCIGNMQMLAKVPLWSRIIHTLRENHQIGPSLRLCCQNHPETHTLVSKASDFQKVPEGGCSLPCEFRLACGHVCTRACHPYDSSHKEFQCMKPCQKVICPDGHRCPNVCFQECQPCQVKVPKIILKCGHKQMVPCSMSESDFCCQEPCSKILRCGHRCSHLCGEDCVQLCSEKVTVNLNCGHSQLVKCGNVEDLKYGLPVKCSTRCDTALDCGHPCPGSCHSCFEGRFHERCHQPCKRLLICSHKCQEPCTGECPPCQRTCQNRCVHSQCKKKCGELCSPCVEPCVWRCQHYQCTKLCSEPCNRPPCYVPCTKLLACGHPCIGLCGEPCPKKCRVCHLDEVTQIFFGFEDEPDARFVQLEDCSHIFEVQALDRYMNEQKDDEVAIKLKVCPICQVPIRKNLRYGTSIKQRLEEIEMVKEKIQGSAGEIAASQERLQTLLKSKTLFHQLCPEEFLKLQEKLAQKNLSVKDLGLVENSISFYDHLANLEGSLEKVHDAERERVRTRLEQVHEWLAKKRLSFSSQELSDLQTEIQRLTYLVNLLMRCKIAENVNGSVAEEVSSIRNILEKTSKFTQEDEQLVQKKMDALKTTLPCSGLGISEEERVQIVTALGVPRGHWFKCPNGHIYVITECGGAMQRSICPECKEVIGGENHTLERSNQLAPEMDGAQHPAWSDTANNFMNFEEIHRMM
ncbi:NFX1-type zinc finger-containing protein 1 [Apodemus sylvaticus]|uniref:NFX1-type zinc finger-containing protein 1 n=1 Tax=Apodemus sylvaticus TaxID=10129 RepID=UPI002244C74A|nr:NFX1-type zinc finger-containing protein 1 [Apodemus sylvaticus]XP_052040296.1 NFX1-type zinc finger-containing protein 1 [Apodemus sylvaticus]XP_052040297.1 NFX1-type zinc finger-containing protein 1 [Apodemus sylvaticus]XP_052040298.1 NFX1-type zinc finger-containing protein 1 [Apodemus sylvaticus]XP_052040299.1 NFX1-type zinc finger-containing protein 1 [Apodemus sylvaticus]